jgi:hypothetical protein
MELIPPSAGDEREIGYNSADGGFVSTANLKPLCRLPWQSA